MKQTAGKCIFCGAPANSGEHIFSKWTHAYMLPRVAGRVPAFRGVETFEGGKQGKTVLLPGQLRDWKVRCVCGGPHTSCNNGWMREIDERAKPHLIPLFEGRDCRLGNEQQLSIAAWATLKVMVGEHQPGTFKPTVHHMQRKQFMRTWTPPNGWGVWAAAIEPGAWPAGWVMHRGLMRSDAQVYREGDGPPSHFNTAAATQVIAGLLLTTLHAPLIDLPERWDFPLVSAPVYRLWPPTGHAIKWSGTRKLTGRDADVVAGAFLKFWRETAHKTRERAIA